MRPCRPSDRGAGTGGSSGPTPGREGSPSPWVLRRGDRFPRIAKASGPPSWRSQGGRHGVVVDGNGSTPMSGDMHPTRTDARLAYQLERDRNQSRISELRARLSDSKERLREAQEEVVRWKERIRQGKERGWRKDAVVDRKGDSDGQVETMASLPDVEELSRAKEMLENAASSLVLAFESEASGLGSIAPKHQKADESSCVSLDREKEMLTDGMVQEARLHVCMGQVRTQKMAISVVVRQQERQIKALVKYLKCLRRRKDESETVRDLPIALARSASIETTNEGLDPSLLSTLKQTMSRIDSCLEECTRVAEDEPSVFPGVGVILVEFSEHWAIGSQILQASIDLLKEYPAWEHRRREAMMRIVDLRGKLSKIDPLRTVFQRSLHVLSSFRNKLLRQAEQYDFRLGEMKPQVQLWEDRLHNATKNGATLDRLLASLLQGLDEACSLERKMDSMLFESSKKHARISAEYKGARLCLGRVEEQHKKLQERLRRLEKEKNGVEHRNRTLRKELDSKSRQNQAASLRQSQCVRNLLSQNQTTDAMISRLKECQDLWSKSEAVINQRRIEIECAEGRISSLHKQVADAEVDASLLHDDIDRFVSPYIALSAARTRVAALEQRFEDSTDPKRRRQPTGSLLTTMLSDRENLSLIIEDTQQRMREQESKLSSLTWSRKKVETSIEETERQIIAVRNGEGLDDAKKIMQLQHKVRSTGYHIMALVGERGMWLVKIDGLMKELERLQNQYGRPEEARLHWSKGAETMQRIRLLPAAPDL